MVRRGSAKAVCVGSIPTLASPLKVVEWSDTCEGGLWSSPVESPVNRVSLCEVGSYFRQLPLSVNTLA